MRGDPGRAAEQFGVRRRGVELVAGGDVGVAAVGFLRRRIDEQLVQPRFAEVCDAAQVGGEFFGADVDQVHLQLGPVSSLRSTKSTPRQSDSLVWKSG